MATVSLPYQLVAGTPENVNNLMSNLNALVAGVNTIDTAQIANDAVTATKMPSGVITADKLSSSVAEQIGISQTSTTRSVTVTQAAEINTTSTSGTVIATSSELATASNGILQIVIWAEAKITNTSATATVLPEINDSGTWLSVSGNKALNVDSSGNYSFQNGFPLTASTTYKKIGNVVRIPFVSNGLVSSSNKSQFRIKYNTSNASYAAYVKNLTATMTFFAA